MQNQGKDTPHGLDKLIVSWQWPLLIGAALTAVLLAFSYTTARISLENDTIRRAEYAVRFFLENDPQLDKRIKILAWDDKTIELLNSWKAITVYDLPLLSWERLFVALDKQQPAAILLDKLFEFPLARADATSVADRIKKLSTPIYAGATVADRGFWKYDNTDWSFRDSKALATHLRVFDLEDQHIRMAYPEFTKGFSGIGHISVERENLIRLGYRFETDKVLATLPLLAAGEVRSKNGNLQINGSSIDLIDDSYYPINFVDRSAFEGRITSMGWALQSLGQGKSLDFINKGDIVLVLPHFYTGKTDFVHTVIGNIEGGLMLASVINGFLSGEHIRYWEGGKLLIPLFIFLMAILAARSSPRVLWTTFATTTVLTPLLFTLLFTYFRVQTDWLTPLLGSFVAVSIMSGTRQISNYLSFLMVRKDLTLGQQIQASIMPDSRSTRIGNWQVAIQFQPYGPLSGDWYQMWVNSDSESQLKGVVAIGDVVGKGIGASLSTAVISSVWRQTQRHWEAGEFDLNQLVSDIDDAISYTFLANQNSTLSIAALYEDHAELMTCGTFPWMHRMAEGQMQRVKSRPRDMLGIGRFKHGPLSVIKPGKGDFLVAYTDGVIDSLADATRFRRALQSMDLRNDDKASAKITQIAKEVGQEGVQPDDVTMITIERLSDTAFESADTDSISA